VTEVFSRPEFGNWLSGRSPLIWLREQLTRFFGWLDRMSGSHPLLYRLFFWGLVLVLIALVVHIGYTLWVIYQRTTHPKTDPGAPAAPARASVSPARRAETLAREGRFTEALAWRFIALVRDLDARKVLQAKDSKTPAEYVAEARLDADGRATLAGLVGSLYRHLFGAEPCDAAGYAEFNDAAHSVLSHVA
jgi:hypothetical protein